jgi:hypothetical protein
MMTLSMISFLVGTVLGQRFKIVVLIPVFAIVLVFAVGTGIALAQTAWWVVLMATAAVTCLQIGYLFGIGVHHVLAAALSRKSSSLSPTTTSARPAAR